MVLTTTIGTPLDARNMLRHFYRVLDTPDPEDPETNPARKRRLLPRFRFHDLRHSAATLLLAQGYSTCTATSFQPEERGGG